MTVMRKAIAEHMVRSVQTSAHVTAIFEVDMAKVVAIRDRLKGEYEQRHGVRLTYLAFIARAVVDALQSWPRMNAEIRGDQIVIKQSVNLGIAVALDDGKGLIVPVIRGAEEKNLLGIARAIQDLAERARTKKLSPDEVQGGTFTITNPGGFGAIGGTPIINQPQVGIIDVEAIVKRPWVVSDEQGNDTIAVRPIMNLCISYDHRLVDGAYAAPFMRDIRTSLETWDESLLLTGRTSPSPPAAGPVIRPLESSGGEDAAPTCWSSARRRTVRHGISSAPSPPRSRRAPSPRRWSCSSTRRR